MTVEPFNRFFYGTWNKSPVLVKRVSQPLKVNNFTLNKTGNISVNAQVVPVINNLSDINWVTNAGI